ncbi:MAG: type II toxin-antitoxin system HicA family toxin [Candidatus Vogelbacteria bacterium]|nr:type II toxin-antitoxin system HicA family toxin [Candidatus Vogelbacteria bacterium]
MPRLPSLSHKRVIKFLETHGFELDHSAGSHFIYYNEISKRRVTVPTHNRDVVKSTLLSILEEAGFSRDDLFEFLRK